MHSGVLAAEVAHEALQRGDVSARALRPYGSRLRKSYVGRNLKLFRHVPAFISNSRLYGFYPEAACRVAEDFFRARESGHRKLLPLLISHVGRVGLLKALRDGWSALRAFFF
jgi:flavin-dependent dehydrogenase